LFGNATKRPGTEFVTIGGAGCYFDTSLPDDTKIGISTPQELQDVENDLSGDYQILNDIDMTGFDFDPIGQSADFTGTLDGRYYTISNLTITAEEGDYRLSRVGLFGSTAGQGDTTDGIIENVILKDCVYDLEGASSQSPHGLLIGVANSSTNSEMRIRNCYASGTIKCTEGDRGRGYLSCGGLIGIIGATKSHVVYVDRCAAEVTFESPVWETVLIGQAAGFVGQILGTSGVTTEINDCYAQSNFTQAGAFAGGTTAWFAGFCNYGDPQYYTVTNCYTAPTKTMTLGTLYGFFKNSWATTVADCFWDGDLGATEDDSTATEGTSGDDGANDMYKEATFTNWDFDTVWLIREGAAYPVHKWYDQCTRCVWLHN